MSESDSQLGEEQEARVPQTTGEALKEIFVRVLNGLGVVGRGLRGGFIATGSCVQRTVYPIKQNCLHQYDQIQRYLNPSTSRGGEVPPPSAVHFTQRESSNEEDYPNLSDESAERR